MVPRTYFEKLFSPENSFSGLFPTLTLAISKLPGFPFQTEMKVPFSSCGILETSRYPGSSEFTPVTAFSPLSSFPLPKQPEVTGQLRQPDTGESCEVLQVQQTSLLWGGCLIGVCREDQTLASQPAGPTCPGAWLSLWALIQGLVSCSKQNTLASHLLRLRHETQSEF